jgi:hypothetical protein
MNAYPSVNWCRGSLRPYESEISFVTRFSALNKATIQQCEQYLHISLSPYGLSPRTGEEIQRIASVLNEEPSLVETVFSPAVILDNCQHSPPLPNLTGVYITYCEECAKEGYHSWLHEMRWLSKCPFHMQDLKTQHSNSAGIKKIVARMNCLQNLMQSHCQQWPWASNKPFGDGKHDCFTPLLKWINDARSAGARFFTGELWQSNPNMKASMAEAIGRLRTLVPTPQVIEPLFTEVGEQWNVEIRTFPLHVKHELCSLLQNRPQFSKIFRFYKSISVQSGTQPSFLGLLRKHQGDIKARHCTCCCHWALEKVGWGLSHWLRVRPDSWPWPAYACPYNFALEELELNWGQRDGVLTYRQAHIEEFEFIRMSNEMHAAGLVAYTAAAHLSTDGNLLFPQPVSPYCEWVDKSSLTELLGAMAEFEVAAAFNNVSEWLDNIDEETAPHSLHLTTDCIRLCETEEGLSLVKWTKPRAAASP